MIRNGNSQKFISQIEEKIFSEFDTDGNNRFSRRQFPAVIKLITKMVGADTPTYDDVVDIFNLLDINGDQTIDRTELMSLIKTLFKILQEQNIEVHIEQESDIIL